MASGHESELKQQGALEAAMDPNSSVTAQQAEDKVVEESRKSGVPAFQFDPNATAQEKAAQMGSYIPEGLRGHRTHPTATLASDADDGTPSKYDLPPPTKAGALAAAPPEANGHIEYDGEDWSRTGWAPRFGSLIPDDLDMTSTMIDTSTWLEERISDKFFGDWYHNAGIIIFACLTSWVVAVLGGGLGWLFLVMACCGTYYRTSIRRVRRNFRDDVNRELAKARLDTDHETLEWINSFLVKFWPIYAPVLCKTIVSSVDQVLSTSTPAFLDSLRMKMFTLGTKPPRLEHVKTYAKTEDDIVMMDWKFSFTPNDVADMTSRQIKVKQNPKIVLEVRLGKGMVSKGLDVIVEDMACTGIMRVKVKLQLPFPHMDRIEICFLEKPQMDYVCKPLGGDTFGFDINFVPGLESFIMEQIHANLGPMMYAPNVFPIEIAKMLAGNPVDQAIGVLQIQFHGAQGLKNPDPLAGTPDPYAVVYVNNRQELGRTKIVKENASPRWNETVNVIISSMKDTLNVKVFDYNEFRKDKELGEATFALDRLEANHEFENEQLAVMANGRARGNVQCDVRFFPVLQGEKLGDGTIEPPPESMTGIARFTVEQAKDLDGTKSLIGELNPYAVLLLNGKEVHISQKLKRTNNPIWADASKELLITNRKAAKLGLVLKDDRNLSSDPIIGSYQIKLDDMLELEAKGQEWYNLAGVKSGRAKMTLQWRPVALRGAIMGSGYITPIGVVRLHLINARDLRNVETVGKSDPYARVLLSGVQKSRTVTWQNNLNPDWDEVIYVPVHTPRERITVEVMDEENMGKDRSLGHFEIPLLDYIHKGESGEYAVHDSKRVIPQPLLSSNRSPKGVISYSCSFFPTLATVDVEAEKEAEEESAKLTTNGDHHPIKGIDSAGSIVKSTGETGVMGSLKTNNSSTSQVLGKKLSNGEKLEEGALPEAKEIPKIRLTQDNLIEYGSLFDWYTEGEAKSGLLVFKLISGELIKANCHLEIIMDDHVFPSYSSNKVKTKSTVFNETGDAIVRELDQSRITLRLVEEADREGKSGDHHVVASLTGPTLQTLQKCLYTATPLTLRDKMGNESKITVNLQYLPIKMSLDSSERRDNMGNLRVDIMDGADLPAADRNGYSDPYCKFILNGKDVYKTDKQKKTLHPSWNETFEVPVRSRTAAKFEVHVFDWDFGDSADFLGKGVIDLKKINPLQRKEIKIPLDGKSGVIRMRLLFTPDFIQKTRQGSSTFHGTFATPGKVIGAPVKGVTKVGEVIGGGVVKTGSFLGRGFRRKPTNESATPDTDDSSPRNGASPSPVTPSLATDSVDVNGREMPLTPSPHHVRKKSLGAASMHSTYGNSPGGAEPGTASITLLSASGYPPATDVQVHVFLDRGKGPKEVHKTKHQKAPEGAVVYGESESFKTQCAGDSQFKIAVKGHKTFGSDEDLGEAAFFISDQGYGSNEQSVVVGAGKVVLRSSFTPADVVSATTVSKNPLKKGVALFGAGKRDSKDGRERSVTPAT